MQQRVALVRAIVIEPFTWWTFIFIRY
jgi:hypothetical protein